MAKEQTKNVRLMHIRTAGGQTNVWFLSCVLGVRSVTADYCIQTHKIQYTCYPMDTSLEPLVVELPDCMDLDRKVAALRFALRIRYGSHHQKQEGSLASP